jgi:hypothetical protein
MKLMMILLVALELSTAQLSAQSDSVHEPHGSHGVRNEQYGLFLRPRDASNRDGEPIVLYPYQPWKCMAWRFESVTAGTRLVNFFTGKSFELQQADAGKALVQMPSASAHERSETFRFIALQHGLYEIAGDAGEALTATDIDGHGDVRVVLSPWKNSAAQRWQLVDIPDHFTM